MFKELFEKTFKIYDKVTLRRTLLKTKSGWIIIDPQTGKWTVDARQPKDQDYPTGAMKYQISDLRDYHGHAYDVKNSISVSFRDIESGNFDVSEVGR